MDEAGGHSSSRICVGIVTGPHGLNGLVRVRPFTAEPEDIAAYGPVESADGTRSLTLDVRNRTGKGHVLVRVDGVDDRTAAEALRGMELYVPRERLPDADADEFYHADLIGLPVEAPDGTPLGKVRALYDFGGGDVLEIEDADGRVATIPFTLAAVPEVDISAGRLVADPEQVLRSGGNDGSGATDGTDGHDE